MQWLRSIVFPLSTYLGSRANVLQLGYKKLFKKQEHFLLTDTFTSYVRVEDSVHFPSGLSQISLSTQLGKVIQIYEKVYQQSMLYEWLLLLCYLKRFELGF